MLYLGEIKHTTPQASTRTYAHTCTHTYTHINAGVPPTISPNPSALALSHAYAHAHAHTHTHTGVPPTTSPTRIVRVSIPVGMCLFVCGKPGQQSGGDGRDWALVCTHLSAQVTRDVTLLAKALGLGVGFRV